VTNNNLVTIYNNKPITTSLKVAEVFGKRHDHVIRDIDSLECSDQFRSTQFWGDVYLHTYGRKQKQYIITRDGFVILVMGFTGTKAMRFKETYINAFNQMETYIIQKQREEDNNSDNIWKDIISQVAEVQQKINKNPLPPDHFIICQNRPIIKVKDKDGEEYVADYNGAGGAIDNSGKYYEFLEKRKEYFNDRKNKNKSKGDNWDEDKNLPLKKMVNQIEKFGENVVKEFLQKKIEETQDTTDNLKCWLLNLEKQQEDGTHEK
jgi:Rha family phage regulatory protein